ncbi:hypothetical protein ACVGVM_20580 [Pseudonocardia bannensis]|uniref:Uncharacterized protein n=1 Tax=Pseudonocardia bannensis TaxID=630973 RepID=A0A848DFM3_9PSEU|nr:hypothetical protein [Pseudonocardia bannensis]NMH91450.1 hypothetical protein [Pseudonocardia bannensis]
MGHAVGVLGAVGAEQAVAVGPAWGAPVDWHTALLRPDRVPHRGGHRTGGLRGCTRVSA